MHNRITTLPVAHGFWKERKNQREFFQNLAKRFNVQNPSDWGRVTNSDIRNCGGKTLLMRNQGSFQKILSSVFPEIKWEEKWFENKNTIKKGGYWLSSENQRKYFQRLSQQLGIKQPSDWGKFNSKTISKRGGATLMKRNSYSLFNTLQKTFPEIKWEKEWFSFRSKSKSYWAEKTTQKQFLDDLAAKFGIQSPKDWGSVTVRRVADAGGISLLTYYNFSLFQALSEIYPEIHWQKDWFRKVPKYRKNFWENISNQKEFLHRLAFNYSISEPKDWLRITRKLITSNGGQGLLNQYSNSVSLALKTLLKTEWEKALSSSNQHTLTKTLNHLFPF